MLIMLICILHKNIVRCEAISPPLSHQRWTILWDTVFFQ